MANPYSTNQASNDGAIPVRMLSTNPVLADLPTPPPATIAASGNWNSGAISASGLNAIAATAKLTQTGQLVLQRYIDAAGTIPIGSDETVAMTANTLTSAYIANDGVPFASFSVQVNNTSGSTGTLSMVGILATAT